MNLSGIQAVLLVVCVLMDPNASWMEAFESSSAYIGLTWRAKNDSDVLLFDQTFSDFGQCVKQCTTYSFCQSLTYNWLTGDCQGLTEIVNITTESFHHEPGSQYYVKRIKNSESNIIPDSTTTAPQTKVSKLKSLVP